MSPSSDGLELRTSNATKLGPAERTCLEVFPIPIGSYLHHAQLDEAVNDEAKKVASLLTDFNGTPVEWPVPMPDRDHDAVADRLRDWAFPDTPSDSVLYWAGHGWSNGSRVALAHAHSPAAVQTWGVLPATVAEPIRSRQATGGHWAIVIIDTCRSSQFVDHVNADLAVDPDGADRVLLIGVSGDGGTTLGRFSLALEKALGETFGSMSRISLYDLGREMERRLSGSTVIPRRLGEAELVRRTSPVSSSVSGPLDIIRELGLALAPLPEAERRHFLAMAHGAEEGELAWFFVGREQESAQASNWLRNHRAGMLVVTGPAGSGKSAFLGDLLLHSMPSARDLLAPSRLPAALNARDLPPDRCFDDVIHLTGLGLDDVVGRIAAAAQLGTPPSHAGQDGKAGSVGDLDWLEAGLNRRCEPFTLLLDALDEAVEPLALGAALIRRLAQSPKVRLVVGTRASTADSPDYPAADRDLLDAIGCQAAESPDGPTAVLYVRNDPNAVAAYAERRLHEAMRDNRLPNSPECSEAVAAIVARIREGTHTFLFARLVVHELIGDPSLLQPGRAASAAKLLGGDHREVFSAAVTRLSAKADCFLSLFESLALSRGRGVPIREGVWAAMATALIRRSLPEATVTDDDVSAFLRAAEPYVSIDTDAGRTVYRLAHRTFVEHFLSDWRQ